VLQRCLNARQFGLKMIANVSYGYTSASFSGRMPCAELADAIVQVCAWARCGVLAVSAGCGCGAHARHARCKRRRGLLLARTRVRAHMGSAAAHSPGA
jgi:hypothetical protein